MKELLNYIASQPTSTWVHAAQLLAGSTVVATILQLVKHKLKIQDAKKLVTTLLGLLSFITALAQYLIQNQSPTLLGKNTAVIIAGAVFVHRFAVSPLYNKVIISVTSLVSDAHAYRESITPTTEPAPVQQITPIFEA